MTALSCPMFSYQVTGQARYAHWQQKTVEVVAPDAMRAVWAAAEKLPGYRILSVLR